MVISRHVSGGTEEKYNILLSEILNDCFPDTGQKSYILSRRGGLTVVKMK
jgi:hypothetical protein